MLSKGVVSRATVQRSGGREVSTVVNSDRSYDARTTRRAVSLLIEKYNLEFGRLELDQRVDVPIGCGFGASAASALSAVYAVASATGLRAPKAEVARCAYDAEIIEQTGLGTVSVTYDGSGAGAITVPGAPGVARFLNVVVPASVRIVTASLAPYEKRDAFSSANISGRIVSLGDEALGKFLAAPTLQGLATSGEWFSAQLGLESAHVRRLAQAAKSAGALYASQNMMGQAVHAVTLDDSAERVVSAMAAAGPSPRIDVFEVGSVRAGAF